ncbi:amidohydrolase [Cohnella endophytica]|uniref:Amidohydrolase n=1 Tax=Cohnella endophytica TaxID=2419778 RepID=A0A494Y1S5_9BACL|nr:amidohydrolase family protein [Cohnella endophytica]RKP54397.1 amidohydrolase [Cohnella endophytica]
MIIDSHQHYWQLRRGDYGWLTPDAGSVLYQDYMPDRLKQELQRCGAAGTIVVQAAPTMEETDFMLDLCRHEESLLGVVGWLDIGGADFEKHYLRFRADPYFVGIRPTFPATVDGNWSRYPQLLRNLMLLAEDGFPVDLLIRPHDLPTIAKLFSHVPKLKAVINHLAVPDIGSGKLDPWASGMLALAQFELAVCKISGLATVGSGGSLEASKAAPYVKHAVEAFGTERLMFGSDWPVCLQAGSFMDMLAMVGDALPPGLTVAQTEAIFGGNAVRIYRLQVNEKTE